MARNTTTHLRFYQSNDSLHLYTLFSLKRKEVCLAEFRFAQTTAPPPRFQRHLRQVPRLLNQSQHKQYHRGHQKPYLSFQSQNSNLWRLSSQSLGQVLYPPGPWNNAHLPRELQKKGRTLTKILSSPPGYYSLKRESAYRTWWTSLSQKSPRRIVQQLRFQIYKRMALATSSSSYGSKWSYK